MRRTMKLRTFVRGDNERCVFYHDGNDLLVLVYTDDNFFDGEEDSIEWGSDVLGDRFDCKALQWIVPMEPPTDYLGMELAQTNDAYINLHGNIHRELSD